MARRSDHSREELKDLAVLKGLEIIDKNGFKAFSARGAAKAMGYTVGTLYHVFGDLDHYILHINGRILDEWHAALMAGLKRTKQDPLRYLAQGYIDFARQHNNRWTALFEFRMTEDAPLPDWYDEKMERLFCLVEAALLPHSKDAKTTRHNAKILWASIHGICVLSLSGKLDIGGGSSNTKELVDTLLDRYISSFG
jgi:AcrR family transcriptional regulator